MWAVWVKIPYSGALPWFEMGNVHVPALKNQALANAVLQNATEFQ